MGIDFGKLRQQAAKEKQQPAGQTAKEEPTKDLGDALEELSLSNGMLAGRPPSRCGSAKEKKDS